MRNLASSCANWARGSSQRHGPGGGKRAGWASLRSLNATRRECSGNRQCAFAGAATIPRDDGRTGTERRPLPQKSSMMKARDLARNLADGCVAFARRVTARDMSMTNIGTRIARLQVLGAALFFAVAALVVGGMHQTSVAMEQNLEDIRRVSAVMEVADLISENRVAQASLLLEDGQAARALLAKRTGALTVELARLCALTPPGPLLSLIHI